ncbi:sigma-54 dependent transcriptional regulator [Trichlorobacter ammonificans]|uniref:Two component, sigma54 specific, transcriptional regulator, Fis family n=1 Tax=Trichlorobacter ammonificans TaxID=2916410 RepID=A0ABM9D9Y5_9BACT|nr:sigma-54 dependent transcriptional regulator [Trichlorobacter ammonificans]CAH2032022.1 Two component, sigma54 specific, transcriptional regulator, Fis family [Trichlorobacter ammonificans]
MSNSKLFILDDDRKTRDLLLAFLTYQGYDTTIVDNDVGFFDAPSPPPRTLITDLPTLLARMPNILKTGADNDLVVIAYDKAESARILPQDERWLFMPKPLNLDELESMVMRAQEYHALSSRNPDPPADEYPHFLCSTIIGKSRQMLHLFEMIEKVAESSATVLIQGESGTGKELAARAIHQLSGRSNRNFVPINCAAIPEDLLESELFGHVKGSFTGAYANRAGRFEIADKGTLFLDEIGDMKANLQVKLLRVLQTKEFEPVGSTRSQKVDVRIIAATNKNLEEQVANRDFREDLYYRLSVIPITMPPLRERREDIPLLISHFLGQFNRDKRRLVKGFSRESLEILCNYSWPGNVRELENLVERMVTIKESGFITPDDLPEKYLPTPSLAPSAPAGVSLPEPTGIEELPAAGICLNSAVDAFESRLIQLALARTGGNKKEAAALLNLKRTTLIEKLKKKNLQAS